jgi:uncharacterized membrane protein
METVLSQLYDLLFQLMGLFCHQLPDRSIFIHGAQLPLCIRCTAMTLGAVVAALYIVARRPLPDLKLCLLFAVPLGVDVALQGLRVIEGSNSVRAVTGLAFGFFVLIGFLKWLAGMGEEKASRASLLQKPS